jgi:hypothetical membrane protein
MKRNFLLYCGLAAPLLYAATVIFGAAIRPGYSHIQYAISELAAAGAPNKALMDTLFSIYNLLLIAFAVGMFRLAASQPGSSRRWSGQWAAVLVGLIGLSGFAMYFFPQDPAGTPLTLAGALHVVFAGTASLGSIAAVLLGGLWFKSAPGMPAYWVYSLVSGLVILISGGFTAAGMANGVAYFGLLERVTIGTLELWLLIVSIKLLRFEQSAAALMPHPQAV